MSSKQGKDGSPARLPRGPHGLPREEIAHNQRQRLLAAMVQVCGTKGYEATSVADILEVSGVGRETFYELFDDKRDCFLAAHDLLVENLITQVRAAYGSGDAPWPQRIRAALARLLEWLATEPNAARFTVLEMAATGPGYAERFQQFFHLFTELLDDGRELSPTARDLPQISNIAATAIFARIYEEIALGRASELPNLLPTLTFEVLAPFLGEGLARDEAGGADQAAA
ncbi:MAG TPA: TetR/AcrR family transcriptional regulator [Chloroflexota bacterium]|nr:TetR/AcrR family transcriptional regulator [Chloroflexota bacterium]